MKQFARPIGLLVLFVTFVAGMSAASALPALPSPQRPDARLAPLAASIADGQIDRLFDAMHSTANNTLVAAAVRDAGVVIDGPGAAPAADPIRSTVSRRERFDPELPPAVKVKELLEKRTERSETWLMSDGTFKVQSYLHPKYYKPAGSDQFVAIDTQLVVDPKDPAVLVTKGSPLTARFSPLTKTAGGAELAGGGTAISIRPEFKSDAKAIAPIVGTGANSNVVTYPDVIAGVDLRYTVLSDQIKEDIVIRVLPKTPAERRALASLAFLVDGAEFVANADGSLTGTGTAAKLRVERPFVLGKDGTPIERAKGSASRESATPPGQAKKTDRVKLDTDVAWWDALSDQDLPVVIDPTITFNDSSVHHYQELRNPGPNATFDQGWYWVGYDNNAAQTRRTAVWWDYSSVPVGSSVTSALVYVKFKSGSGQFPLSTYEANPAYSGDTSAPGWSFSGVGAGPYETRSIPTDGNWYTLSVTPLYQSKIAAGNQLATVMMRGQETAGTHSIVAYDLYLEITYDPNRPPDPATGNPAPPHNAILVTDTPTMSVDAVTDPDGDAVSYKFEFSTTVDFSASGPDSGWIATNSYSVPANTLAANTDYWWRVKTKDSKGLIQTPSSGWRLRRAPDKLGYDNVGGYLSGVNTVVGNKVFTEGDIHVNATGPELSLTRTYNSLETANGPFGKGFSSPYFIRWIDRNPNIEIIYPDGRHELHTPAAATPFGVIHADDWTLVNGTAWSATKWTTAGAATIDTQAGAGRIGLGGTTVLSDNFTGTNGASWNATNWTTSVSGTATVDIQNNEGRLNHSVTGNRSDARALGAASTQHTDGEITAKVKATGGGAVNFHLRGGTTWNTSSPNLLNDGYYLELQPSSTMKIEKIVGGSITNLGNATVTFNNGTYYRIRFNVSGTTLKARIWPDGNTEPTGWDITVSDSSLTSGRGAVSSGKWPGASAGDFIVDDVVVTSGGSSGGGTALAATTSAHDKAEVRSAVRVDRFDANLYANVWLRAIDTPPLGGSNGWFRYGYALFVQGNGTIGIRKLNNGADTVLASASLAGYTPNAVYLVRFQADGSTLQAKVWQSGTTEPSAWTLSTSDTLITSGYGALSASSAAAGNVFFDDYTLSSLSTSTGDDWVPPAGYTALLEGTKAAGFTLKLSSGDLYTLGTAGFWPNSAGGWLTAIKDTFGRQLNVDYSQFTAQNKITVQDTASGRSIRLLTTGAIDNFRINTGQIDNPAGGVWNWAYTYDTTVQGEIRLTSVCDPLTFCKTYQWQAGSGGKMLKALDGKNQTDFELSYGTTGRVVWTMNALGDKKNYQYTQLAAAPHEITGRMLDERFALNQTNWDTKSWQQVFDPKGLLLREYSPGLAAPTIHEYDPLTTMRTATTDTNGNRTTMFYDPATLRLLQETNAASESTFYVYDDAGNLIKTCDGRSADANTDHAPDADTYCVIASYGSTTTERQLRLIRSQNAPGLPSETWTYTDGTEAAYGGGGNMPAGLLKSTTDVLGRVFTYEYTVAGDLGRLSDTGGGDTRYTYDTLGRTLTASSYSDTYPSGVTNTYTYNALSQQVTATAPAILNVVSNVTHQLKVTNTYDANRNLTTVLAQDLTGGDASRTTTSFFDTVDREWKTTDPEGNSIERRFDAAGNVIAVKDQLGRWTRTTYNDRNLPTKLEMLGVVADPIVATGTIIAQTEYDNASRVTATVDARGNRTETTYNAANRATKVITKNYQLDPGVSATRDILITATTFDAAGHPTVVKTGGPTDASAPLKTTTMTYDNAGRVTTSTLAGVNRTTTFTLNAAGQPLVVNSTQPGVQTGGIATAETRFDYDIAGRVLTQTVENGTKDLITTYSYDSRGLPIATVAPNGNASGANPAAYRTQTLYDALGRPYRTTSPTVTVESGGGAPSTSAPQVDAGYNTFGDVTHAKDARGNITTTTFDRLSRKTQIAYASYTPPGGTAINPTESYAYDAVGNLTGHTDRRGNTTNYEYDAYNRVTKQLDPAIGANPRGFSSAEYDVQGNRTATVNQTGARTEYGYDTRNELRFAKEIVRDVTVVPVAGAPGPQSTTVVSGGAPKFTYFEYDDLGRQTKSTTPQGVVTTATYSPADEVTQIADTANKTVTSTFDVLSQPVRVTDQLGRQNRFEYDQAGRRLSQAAWASDAAGSYTTKSSQSYDANSNVVSSTSGRGNTSAMTYDALNRLSAVTQPKDAFVDLTATYGYDSAGNLTRTRDPRGNDRSAMVTEDYPGNNGAAWPSMWTRATSPSSGATGSPAVDVQAVAGPDGLSGFGRLRTATNAGTQYARALADSTSTHTDAEFATIVRTGASVGNGQAKLWLRGAATWVTTAGNESNLTQGYFAELNFATNQIRLRKTTASTEAGLAGAGATASITYAANTNYRVKFQTAGSTIRAKIWVDSSTEPAAWTVTATDTSITGSGVTAVSLKTTAQREIYLDQTYVFAVAPSGQLQSDTFTGVNGSGWNTANWSTSTAGAATIIQQSNEGQLGLPAGAAAAARALGDARTAHADASVTGKYRTDSLATGTVTSVWLRGSATWTSATSAKLTDGYTLVIQQPNLVLRKLVAGTETTLATATFTKTANTNYRYRFEVTGTTVRARMWTDGTAEPTTWNVTATDTALTTGRAALSASNDGVAAVNVFLDDYAVTSTSAPLVNDSYTASNGSNWSATYWSTSVSGTAIIDIQNNEGRLSHTVAGNRSDARALGAPATQHTDAEMTAKVKATNSGAVDFHLRGGSTWNTSNPNLLDDGYYLELQPSSTMKIEKTVAGTITNLANATVTFNAGTYYRIRFNVTGNVLKARIWQDGTAEPSTWNITVTDTANSNASGRAAISSGKWVGAGASDFVVDDVAVTTSAATAADWVYAANPVSSYDTITTYNPWNLQENLIEPATVAHPTLTNRQWTAVYDAGGLLTEDRQPGAITVANTYDSLARLTGQSSGGLTKTFGYDLASRPTSFNHPTGTQNLVYDDRGLLVGGAGQMGNLVATYNGDHQMLTRNDPAGNHSFGYDTRGRLTTLADPLSAKTLTYTLNDAGQTTRVDYGAPGASPNRTYTYDPIGRLQTDVHKTTAGATTMSTSYSYDADNQITQEALSLPGNSSAGTYNYSYDRLGRLGRFDRTSTTVDYRWDSASNRSAVTTNATTKSWSYDQRNRILTDGDNNTWTWDPRGTLDKITNGATTVADLAFDNFGRLSAFVKSGTTITYTYDGLDRIATRNAGSTQTFAYNGASIDPSLAAGIKYSRSPGERLIGVQNGATTALAGINRHGDLRWLFDTAGNTTDTNIYDPSGASITKTGTTGQNLGFQSDYTDPTTDDVWMGARWYSPANATFRSRDTMTGLLSNPVGFNRYTYAGGNPLNAYDPDGRWYYYLDDWSAQLCGWGDYSACANGRNLPSPGDWIGVYWESGYPRGYIGANWDNSCPAGWQWGGYYGDGTGERGQCATWDCIGDYYCDAEPAGCWEPWLNGDYDLCDRGTCAVGGYTNQDGYCRPAPPAPPAADPDPDPGRGGGCDPGWYPSPWGGCTSDPCVANPGSCPPPAPTPPDPPVTPNPTGPDTSDPIGDPGQPNQPDCASLGMLNDGNGGCIPVVVDPNCPNGTQYNGLYCESVCTPPGQWNGAYCEDLTTTQPGGGGGGSCTPGVDAGCAGPPTPRDPQPCGDSCIGPGPKDGPIDFCDGWQRAGILPEWDKNQDPDWRCHVQDTVSIEKAGESAVSDFMDQVQNLLSVYGLMKGLVQKSFQEALTGFIGPGVSSTNHLRITFSLLTATDGTFQRSAVYFKIEEELEACIISVPGAGAGCGKFWDTRGRYVIR